MENQAYHLQKIFENQEHILSIKNKDFIHFLLVFMAFQSLPQHLLFLVLISRRIGLIFLMSPLVKPSLPPIEKIPFSPLGLSF